MADTVAVMNKGEIEQMGAPEELYELPKTAFVANFLGQSNLFTGPVRLDAARLDRRRHRRPQGRGARASAPSVTPARSRSACGPRSSACTPQEPAAAAGRRTCSARARQRRLVQRRQHPVPGRRSRGSATSCVFAQNMVVRTGRATTAPRSGSPGTTDHGFGLADEPGTRRRFDPDDDTAGDRRQAAHERSRPRSRKAEDGLRRLRERRPVEHADAGVAGGAASRSSCCCRASSTSRCSSSTPLVSLLADLVPGAGRVRRHRRVPVSRSAGRTTPRRSSSTADILGRTFVYAGARDLLRAHHQLSARLLHRREAAAVAAAGRRSRSSS